MRRVARWLAPLLLTVVGVALIIAGQLDLDPPVATLPPIPTPTPTPVALATATPDATSEPTVIASPSPLPMPTPLPIDVVAVQLEVPSVGVNVVVREPTTQADCDFPPSDAAYLICGGSQPGRGTNSYIFAHAILTLFKPLWNVQLGAEVNVLLSDQSVLRYVVTEVRPNLACPDDLEPPHPDPPLALLYADVTPQNPCPAAAWQQPTDHERLTLQTSQGFNRNWGELIIIAEPAR